MTHNFMNTKLFEVWKIHLLYLQYNKTFPSSSIILDWTICSDIITQLELIVESQ